MYCTISFSYSNVIHYVATLMNLAGLCRVIGHSDGVVYPLFLKGGTLGGGLLLE